MVANKNVGSSDAIIRIIAGLLILSTTTLAHLGPKSNLAYLGLIGLLPMITGITGYCHPYKIMGINTRIRK